MHDAAASISLAEPGRRCGQTTGADVQGHHAHLRRACRRLRGFARRAAAARPPARRAGRRLPRKADRDGGRLLRRLGRRRRLRADQPAAASRIRSATSSRDCGVRVLVTSAERLRAASRRAGRAARSVEHVIVVGEVRDGVATELACDRARLERPSDAAARPPERAGSTSTSPRSSTPRGAPGSRRASCSRTATCSSAARASASTSATHGDDRILAVLPLSFDAGFSQLTTAFAVGAHVVLVNYLLPRDVVGLCARAPGDRPDLRAAAVAPARATRSGRPRRSASTALLRQHRRADAPRDARPAARRSSPRRKPYLMYGLTEAFRSTYLDPAEVDAPPGLDRQGDPERRDPGRARGR